MARSTKYLFLFLLALLLGGSVQSGPRILGNFRSPRNKERPARSATRYIILHTTEAPSKSALQKLSRRGEAHYLIDEGGMVYRIVDRHRVAYHCGLSLWDGRSSLDNSSIGIEIAGYHNRDIRAAQLQSLRALLEELQRIYKIPDERVLTHSMVAYGKPNRWHPRSHRGRKRCAMQFARWSVRTKLGLTRQPRRDPDVAAGRLVVADPYLADVLYGSAGEQDRAATRYATLEKNIIAPNRSAWDIAREHYNRPGTTYIFPDGTRRAGDRISNWRAMPPGTRVVTEDAPGEKEEREKPRDEDIRTLGIDGDTALALAGQAWQSARTLYLFDNGKIKPGDQLSENDAGSLPSGTRLLFGYRVGGPITPRQRAFDVCGPHWNAPETIYVFPDGSIRTGNRVDESRIPHNTMVLIPEE